MITDIVKKSIRNSKPDCNYMIFFIHIANNNKNQQSEQVINREIFTLLVSNVNKNFMKLT